MRRCPSWARLLPCLLLTFGCGYQKPGVQVGEVAMVEATDEALALAFVLDLTNPNPAAVELDEFTYTVSIDGMKVYAGRRAAEATLGASGSRRITIPAVIPFHDLGWTARTLPADAAYKIRGRLRYLAPSQLARIFLDTNVLKPGVGFAGEGRVELE